MNWALGQLFLIVGIVQVSVDSAWFCVSMLWSIGGFIAGVVVGYLLRLTQERLGRRPHDHT